VLLIFPAASEILPIQLQNRLRCGILTVTLYEGAGLSVADNYSDVFRKLKREPNWENEEFRIRSIGSSPFNHRFLPYAILDFGKSQVVVESVSGSTKNPLWAENRTTKMWGAGNKTSFDVSRVAELTIYLYLRSPIASGRNQDFFLGVTKLNPWVDKSQEENTSNTKWLDIQDGTGKIRIGVEFTERTPPRVGDFDVTSYLDYIKIYWKWYYRNRVQG
jgi:serum/glucocorticoid-regulated kinase 2